MFKGRLKFKGSFKDVSRKFKGIYRKFQGCIKEVSRAFKGSLWKYQGCFKKVSWMFQLRLKVVSSSFRGFKGI